MIHQENVFLFMCLFPFQSINIYDRFIDTVKLGIGFKQNYRYFRDR